MIPSNNHKSTASVALNKQKLIGLINIAKDEIIEHTNAYLESLDAMDVLYNNQMQATSAMAMHLVSAHSVRLLAPIPKVIPNYVGKITPTLAGEDFFTEKVVQKLRKQAMYFGCFSGWQGNFPDRVVAQAKELLVIKTKTALYNEMNLRFCNLTILAEFLKKEKFVFTHQDYTISGEKLMNGTNPYYKLYAVYNNPVIMGNNYEISKTMYSYEFRYLYLGNMLQESMSFGNTDGGHVMELPEGLLPALDACIAEMYYDCKGMTQENHLLLDEVNRVTDLFKQIVNVGLTKFDPEEGLTDDVKLSAIGAYMIDQLRYKRSVSVNNQSVFDFSNNDITLTPERDAIQFKTEVYTFTKVGDTYDRLKKVFEFNHLKDSPLLEEFEQEDRHVQLFDYWVINALAEEFETVLRLVNDLTRLKKFGSAY